MKTRIEIGKEGEAIALKLFQSKGYKILETNWRFGHEEIDIIARDGDFIVIAEVKTRSANALIEPEMAVNKSKQRIQVRAANAYVHYKNLKGDVRFDIVSIILKPDGNTVNHIVDAFYATL
jgi:putative endonuclease